LQQQSPPTTETAAKHKSSTTVQKDLTILDYMTFSVRMQWKSSNLVYFRGSDAQGRLFESLAIIIALTDCVGDRSGPVGALYPAIRFEYHVI